MRALFAFSYTVRIVVIHFILINSSITNAKKYQNVRNESNLETLARQRRWLDPTQTEKMSDGRILRKNQSDRSFRKEIFADFGKKNVVFLNESARRPSEDVKGVASHSTNTHRRSKRCLLAGMLHKKMMFAKHFFFRPPLIRPIQIRPPAFIPPRPPSPRRPPQPKTTKQTEPPTRKTTPRPETSKRGPPLPRPTPKRIVPSRPAAAHTSNVLEFRETVGASVVAGCKFIVHPGVPVVNGVPKYSIAMAVVVKKIMVIRRPPGYFVWEFQHPKLKACIELPVFGPGDTYVDPISRKVFIIFVDINNTTLLIPKLSPPVEKRETCIYHFDKTLIFATYLKIPGEGSSVVNGSPQHDIRTALWVWHTTKVIDSKGILVHRFTHPTDKYEVQIPAYGTDEYFEAETSQVFLLFVDKNNRTLLVYKGVIEQKLIIRQPPRIDKPRRENVVWMVHKYRGFGNKHVWGSMVIRGVPKYCLNGAKFIEKTETIIDKQGFTVIQFEHPITGQRIQIPSIGGDEYVLPSSSKKFIIFVDSTKRTLLVPKDIHPSKVSRDCVTEIKIDVTLVVMKYREIAQKRNVGLTVISGVPKYDITTAIFVNTTYKIIDSDNFLVIYFIHPTTGEGIQIPVDGGDEYVLTKESKVYVIFVDRFGRTLLILKGLHPSNKRKPPGQKQPGSIVIQGVPKYNLACVLFVNKTDKLIHSQKVPMIQFVHPKTGEKIQIPANGGDEFLLPLSSQIFLIYVDNENRTLLIFKEKYKPKGLAPGSGKNCKNLLSIIFKHRQIAREKEWGSMVIHGVPKYNKSCAIFVNNTERMLDSDGCFIIQFDHPITQQKIHIPAEGGDEYVMPSIFKVFLIFVDNKKRTLLVLKPPPSAVKSPAIGGSKCPNVFYALNKYRLLAKNENWGRMVVQGAPKYNTSFSIFVDKANKMLDSEGCVMIEFVHPITGDKIKIPYYGGDEFVVPAKSTIFVIFVDNRGRTLFVFKDKYSPKELQSPNDRGDKCLNIKYSIRKYQQMAREKEWGTIVVHGVPRYNPTLITFVDKTTETFDYDGCLIIQFAHPVTKQEMHVPYNGGDEFVLPLESKIYVVFVDSKARTLLIFKDKYPPSGAEPPNDTIFEKHREKPQESGPILNVGSTKYNLSGAIFVDNTQPAKDSDGILLIHFVHPTTGQRIKIPFYGGVSYSPPFTNKVYIIFVDTKGRTLLVLRPRHPTNDGSLEKSEIFSFAIKKYQEMARKNGWGSIVVRGVPNYDISGAIFVNDTENKIDSDGCLVINFVHPITSEKILIPYHGGDEYVLPRTSRVYVLFVDTKGRTLLIFKKEYPSSVHKQRNGMVVLLEKQQLWNGSDSNKAEILKKWWNLSMEEGWGWLVVKGVPGYDLSRAIFVMKTEKTTDVNGFEWIRFVHPVTGRGIKVPVVGTDEYTLSRTSQVFLIFVDLQRRTLLILKANGNERQDIGWGTLVVGGRPRYDLSRALYVIERNTLVDEKGTIMLDLVHPVSKKKVRMPLCCGDEYVDPYRARIFLIVVDSRGKTILIFKGMDDAKWNDRNGGKLDLIIKTYNMMARANLWGALVVGGLLKPNLSRAIIVMETKTESGQHGMVMIRFEDPRNKRKMLVPFLGGEELVDPQSLNIYIMFVDLQGQLLLIFKGVKNSRDFSESSLSGDDRFRKELDRFIKEYDAIAQRNKWGKLVRNGRPQYDLEKAIIVGISSKTWTSDGRSIIKFVHPVNGEKMYIPAFGGDEYVDLKTREVFIIFVDTQGRTCLIPKNNKSNDLLDNQGIENFGNKPVAASNGVSFTLHSPSRPDASPFKNHARLDLANATYVPFSSHHQDSRGNPIIKFIHPITNESIQIAANQGEEYYDPKSQKVFNIYVDRAGRTLLVPKPERSPSSAQNIPGSMGQALNTNINKNINKNVLLSRL